MSDQTSIFDNTNSQPTQAPQAPASNPGSAPANADPVATLLASIKNERGEQKYADLPSALEGLRNAQEYIPTLKAEQAAKDAEIERLRVQAERAAELERTLNDLTNQRRQDPATPAPVLDESKLADLVNRQLTQREQQALAQANLSSVVSTLQSVFGTDAEVKFYGKAEELGMSKEEINTLAAKSPKAVLTMLGVKDTAHTKPTNHSPTQSTVNTAAYTPQQDTFIGRNPKPLMVGATTQELNEGMGRAKKMVEELHNSGREVHELTNPKAYFKFFNQ